MGWDITFIRSKKIGEILNENENFKIEFNDNHSDCGYIYVENNDGDRSGIVVDGITKENYTDRYLDFGRMNYNHHILSFLWELYEKLGICFGDEAIEMYFHLSNSCESEEESEKLLDYLCYNEMTHLFEPCKEDEKYKELCSKRDELKPIFDKIYKKSVSI